MKRWQIWASLAALVLAVLGLIGLPKLVRRVEAPIVVGLVHSKSGPLGNVESGILDAEILALEEINAGGGLLGRRVEWVIGDGRSDPQSFGREAHRLVMVDRAVLIVGGLTSECRRELVRVVEPVDAILIHPGAYEGLEDVSLSWLGLGPMPNQSVIPAVSWCVDELHAKKLFLVGSRDVFSYAAVAIARDQAKALGATVVGEGFVGLDGSGAADLAAAMKRSGADVAVSTIVGEANVEVFRRVAAVGLTPEKLPIVSLRLSEDEVGRSAAQEMAGHYAGAAYFQSLDQESNRRFVDRFKTRFGADRTISDAAASAYYGLKLWAQAVAEAESTEMVEVQEHLSRQSVEVGEGVVAIDHDLLHVWRPFRIGKIEKDGRIEQVWALDRPVQPIAYPLFRGQTAWEAALEKWWTTGQPGGDAPAASPAAPSAVSPAAARAVAPVVWGPRGAVRPATPGPVSTQIPARSAAASRPASR